LLTTNVAKFHVAFLRLNYHYTKAAVGGEKESLVSTVCACT